MDKFFRLNFWKVGTLVMVFAILVFPVLAHAAAPTIGDVFTGGWWGDKDTGLLACNGEICDNLCQLLELLNNLLFFGLTILLYVIAPIRFIMGGFLIMTGGASEGLSRGKAMIKGTAIGILIALGGFAIVATFLWLIGNNSVESGQSRVAWPEIACTVGANPGNIPYPTSTITFSTSTPGTGPGTGQPGNHADNLAELEAADIDVWSSGVIQANCTTANCTSLEGLPRIAIDGLIKIKNDCDTYYHILNNTLVDCSLVVTAGTEVLGHKTHGPGNAIVDIDNTPSVNEYVYQVIGLRNPQMNHWYNGSDGFFYFYEGDHWHVCFGGDCHADELG